MMLSCDAEYFTLNTFLGLNLSLQLRAHFSTFLASVLRAHASAENSTTEKHFVSSANNEIPMDGEDIDDGIGHLRKSGREGV